MFYLLILYGFVFPQNLVAQTKTELKHLPDGSTTILTPAGEDLGVRFQLKSVLMDGIPIDLNIEPQVHHYSNGSVLSWHDAILEHWLVNGSNNHEMELILDLSKIAKNGQKAVVEYLFDSAGDGLLMVSGSYNYWVNDSWSLGSQRMWLNNESCQLPLDGNVIQYKHFTKDKINRFEFIANEHMQSVHVGLSANLYRRGAIANHSKPDRFYLNNEQLIISDYSGQLSYYSQNRGVFEFVENFEPPYNQNREHDFGCRVFLDEKNLVIQDCDSSSLFFYQKANQKWQLNNTMDLRSSSSRNFGGVEYLYADQDKIMAGYASLIHTFAIKKTQGELDDVFDVKSELGHGHLEGFVVDGEQMAVLTQPEHSKFVIHVLEKKQSNWVLADQKVMAERNLSFPEEQMILSDGLLAIPMDSEEPEVWVFDLNKKLKHQSPTKLVEMAESAPRQHFDNGLGSRIVISGQWIYVLSSSRQERSQKLDQAMPNAVCLSDSWGRVDAWNKKGRNWQYAGPVPIFLDNYTIYDLIQDQDQVYMVVGERDSSQFELMAMKNGKAVSNQSMLVNK